MSMIKVEVLGAVVSRDYDMTATGGPKGVSHTQAVRYSWGRGDNASSIVAKLKLVEANQAYPQGVFYVAPEGLQFAVGMPQIMNKPPLMTVRETVEYLRDLINEIEMN